MKITRRQFLRSVSLLALFAGGLTAESTPASAATTVTYTVNFAGDFTTLQSAFNGIGTDFTASSTGQTTGSGSTTTVIQLNASETKDFTGHPLTIGGTTCLITSYNTSTKVATVSARAGFPAAFGSSPGSGVAYTIADVQVTLTFGQSASGNNLWTDTSTGIACPSITMDSSHVLTINGATAWNKNLPLNFNYTGNPLQAVGITSSTTDNNFNLGGKGGLINFVAGAFVNINNLGVWVSNQNPCGIGWANGATVNCTNCWVGAFHGFWTGPLCALGTAGGTQINSIFYGGSNEVIYGVHVCYGCGLLATQNGWDSWSDGSTGSTFTDCWSFGVGALQGTYTNGASNLSKSGVTTLTASSQFVNFNTSALDLRPLSTSGLIGIGGTDSHILTDMFGVTRSLSNVTIGSAETGVTVPATQNLTYSIAFNGDLASPCPNGAVSSLSWTGGIATLTTSAPHGLTIGTLVPLGVGVIGGTSPYFNTLGSGYSAYSATVTGASTITYPLASNPGAAPGSAAWFVHGLNYLLGTATGLADLTYFQTLTTGSGSTTTQVVLDPSATAACVGHPIKIGTTTCMIIAYNAGTNTATVGGIGAIGGTPLSSAFPSSPSSGTAYTIYPTNITFNIGAPASGSHTLWQFDVFAPNSAAICIGPGVNTTSTSAITVQGTVAFDKAVALGTITDGASAIALQQGNTTDNAADHTAVIGVGASFLTINQLQLWQAGSSEPDGCLLGQGFTNSPVSPTNVLIESCVLKCDFATPDEQHSPFIGQPGGSNPTISNPVFQNCALISADYRAIIQIQNSATLNHCTVTNTANAVTTTVGTTSSGSNSVTVASVANIQTGSANSGDGSFIYCPSLPNAIPYDTICVSISGNTIFLAQQYGSVSCIGGISGTTLTLGGGTPPTIGQTLSGPGIAAGTTVVSGSGPYVVSVSQTVAPGTQIQIYNTVTTASSIPNGAALLAGVKCGIWQAPASAENTAFFGMSSPVDTAVSSPTFTTCATDSNALSLSGLTVVGYPAQFNSASSDFGVGVDVRPKSGNNLQAGTFLAGIPTDIYGTARANPPTIGAVEFVAAAASGMPFMTSGG